MTSVIKVTIHPNSWVLSHGELTQPNNLLCLYISIHPNQICFTGHCQFPKMLFECITQGFHISHLYLNNFFFLYGKGILTIKSWLYYVHCATSGAIAAQGSYTERVWPSHINDLNCTGNEESVWECPRNGIVGYMCNRYQDASVMCQGMIPATTYSFLIAW